MDLERRVKVLEDELKILKNQIQNTLLDIQGELGVSIGPGKHPVSPAAAVDTGMEEDEDEGGQRLMTRAAPAAAPRSAEPPAAVRQVAPARALPGSTAPDLATFARLLSWVRTTVGRVGGDAVRQALGLAVSSGQLPSVMQASLWAMLPTEDGKPNADISQVLPVYLELNALLLPEAQVASPVAVMEARSGG
jgi:hypothetical protein